MSQSSQSSFRVQGKHFFVTWPTCGIPLDDVLLQVQTILKTARLKAYIICAELHEDGSPHRHAYLGTASRVDIKNCRRLDLTYEDTVYHANIQKVKNLAAAKQYLKKDGDFITNVEESIEWSDILEQAQEGDLEAAFNAAMSLDPRAIAMNGDRIRSNLSSLATHDAPEHKEYIFRPIPRIEEWQKDQHACWILGPSGTGKTEYAKSMFDHPLVVRHIDALKNFKPGHHDVIIFDDMSFLHWPRTSCIHIVDLANPSDINVKYGTVRLPAGLPRIFTSNVQIWPKDPTNAIYRRVSLFKVTSDLRVINEDNQAQPNPFEPSAEDFASPKRNKPNRAWHHTYHR